MIKLLILVALGTALANGFAKPQPPLLIDSQPSPVTLDANG